MIFEGRNQIPFWYSVYNCLRSGGYHRGVDIVGLDSKLIHATTAGTVRKALCVINRSDKTWEWGWYIRIDDAKGRKHYYCHCAANSFRVKVGQKVKAGDVIATMGNTGNAALASPPIEHVHYEVRTAKDAYLDPCQFAGVDNAVGIYGTAPVATAKRLYVTAPTEFFAVSKVDEPIGKLQPDTNYEITQVSNVSEAMTVSGVTYTGQWCKIRMADGDDYWVLALTDRCEIRDVPKPLCALYNLNLRSAPGTKYAKLGTLAKGDEVGDYLEQVDNWARVKTKDGWAWLCTDYVGAV